MAEITVEMVKQTYTMAKKIYNNEIGKYNGIKYLHEKYSMNENSAAMYINNFRCLINGQEYGRIMKADDTNYFLMQILNDYGENAFKKALYAVKQHIEYIKSINKPSNVEQLYKDFIKKYNVEDSVFKNLPEEKRENEVVELEDEVSTEPAMNFTYERDLQTALVRQAEKLFSEYKIFGEDLEGVQYQIEGKKIDLLLENAQKNELLALELKAGIADFKVFGQISMYLGLLKREFPRKNVKGIIIAGKIDETLKFALTTNENVKVMEYKMELTLNEV
jgi:ribosomal protein L25 (general stress protein Ctc)